MGNVDAEPLMRDWLEKAVWIGEPVGLAEEGEEGADGCEVRG